MSPHIIIALIVVGLLVCHQLSKTSAPVKKNELLSILSYDVWRSTTDIQNRFEKKYGARLTIDQIYSEMKVLIESGLAERRELDHRSEFRKIKKGKPETGTPVSTCLQPA